MDEQWIGAIDIGGTKTIAAVMDRGGRILAQKRFYTNTSSWERHFRQSADALQALCVELSTVPKALAGIGIAVPGMADPVEGKLIRAPFAAWTDVPAREWFLNELDNDNIQVENDVNACALGEIWFGHGERFHSYLWMTVSTGIGGGLVEGGRLLRGSGLAGEVGHLKVEYIHPRTCSCGQSGCLEAHASGSAIAAMTHECIQLDPVFAEQVRCLGMAPDAAGCAQMARQGNLTALEIYRLAAVYLARGISYALNLFHPQAVFLGGGVAGSLDLLLPTIEEELPKLAVRQVLPVKVEYTGLGYSAALLGAAALVMANGAA